MAVQGVKQRTMCRRNEVILNHEHLSTSHSELSTLMKMAKREVEALHCSWAQSPSHPASLDSGPFFPCFPHTSSHLVPKPPTVSSASCDAPHCPLSHPAPPSPCRRWLSFLTWKTPTYPSGPRSSIFRKIKAALGACS